MSRKDLVVCAAVMVGWGSAQLAPADVFNMPGGLTSLEVVTVGNPRNAGELSGHSAGGFGEDRICGAVDYTYNIGKYEVTAGQYTEFLNKVAKTDTYGLYNAKMYSNAFGCKIWRRGSLGNFSYSVASGYANRPVDYVSYWAACRFANWLHNGQPSGAQGAGTTETGAYTLNGYNGNGGWTIQRNTDWKWAVTSEDEWYKAAYHKNDGVTGNYFDYPTSSDTAPGRDLADASGNNANYFGIPCPIDPGDYTTLVGEFQNSDSPYGTFDQGGNMWEWNEAVVYAGAMQAFVRGLRGGSFNFGDDALQGSARYRWYPAYEDFDSGFRVSEVPEPGCAGLFLLAGLISARRRRARP